MVYDPFGLMSEYMPPVQPLRARNPIQPYKDPEEESGVLGNVLGKVGGGLGWVGETLGKPGRMLRGAVGGNFRELANVIPFSDTLGITDPTKQTSGEDLLKQWGVLEGEGQKGTFEMRDLAGPALEMATDPLMFTNFGGQATSRAGDIAKRIGMLPSGGAAKAAGNLGAILAANPNLEGAAGRAASAIGTSLTPELMAQKLGGHIGFGLPIPGTSNFATMDLSGPLGIAGKIGKMAWNQVPFHEPLGNLAGAAARTGRALFSKPVQNTTDELLQPLMAGQHAAQSAMERGGIEQILGFRRAAEGSGIQDLRGMLEMGHPGSTPEQQAVLSQVRQFLDQMPGAEQAVGGKIAERSNYFPTGAELQHEGLTELARHGGGAFGRDVLSVSNSAQRGREDILNNLLFEQKQKLLSDPAILGSAEARRAAGLPVGNEAEHILSQYLGVSNPALATPEQVTQARSLADWASTLAPERANLPFFDPDPWNALTRRWQKHASTVTRGDTLMQALATKAGQLGADTVPLSKAVARLIGAEGPGQESAAALERFLATMAAKHGPEILGTHVPVGIVNQLDTAAKGLEFGGPLESLLRGADQITNVTKTGMTVATPTPSYQVRNILGGLTKNLGLGVATPKPYGMMQTLLKGPDAVIEGIAQHPQFAHLGTNDAEVSAKLRDLLYAYADVGKFRHAMDEAGRGTRPLAEQLPGAIPWEGLGHHLGQAIPRSLEQAKPWAVQGVGGRTKDVYSLAKSGRAISEHYDDLNRGAGFLGLLAKGYEPAAAGAETAAAHVNWGGLSDFERKFMRRVLPFYSWARGNIPQEVTQLLERPGTSLGALGARVTDQARRNQGFLPPYLGGGLAVPLGSEDDGNQRYLTRLGLPFEQPFDWINAGPNGAARSLGALASQMNPLLKFPIEYMTGKQLHTNRDTGDLYSFLQDKLGLGQKPTTAEQVLANSPFARWETTARTLTDPRKDWLSTLLNLGTGARVSDVDMNKQRDLLARDAISEMLQGQPAIGKFEHLYPRKEMMDQLTPRDMALLRLERTLEERHKQEQKKARAIGIMQ